MDKLSVDGKGSATISNDGATIMKLLDVIHPAAKTLVDIAKSQVMALHAIKQLTCKISKVPFYFKDAEVGDGTTSVVILAGDSKSFYLHQLFDLP